MTELHVVQDKNAHLYKTEIEEYFRGRYQACVVERGWKKLERPDGRDVDQFDTPSATHLMAIEGEQVVGGIRFLPSTGPTILSEVFPYMSSEPLTSSPDIYEVNRIWVTKEQRGRPPPTVEACLMIGHMEFALALGLRKVWAMMEPFRLLRNQQLGWTFRTLGPAHEMDGVSVTAIEKDISEELWIRIGRHTGINRSVLFWNGLQRPSYHLPEVIPAVA